MRVFVAVAVLLGCGGPAAPRPATGAAPIVAFEPPPDEVARAMARLAQAVRDYTNDNGELPQGRARPTPAGDCCRTPSTRCDGDAPGWQEGIWAMLNVSVAEPTRFRFAYRGKDRTFELTATGDPECDGRVRTYVVNGRSDRQNGLEIDELGMLRQE